MKKVCQMLNWHAQPGHLPCPTLPPALPNPATFPAQPCHLPCPTLPPALPNPATCLAQPGHMPCPILRPALTNPATCPAQPCRLPCPTLPPALPNPATCLAQLWANCHALPNQNPPKNSASFSYPNSPRFIFCTGLLLTNLGFC